MSISAAASASRLRVVTSSSVRITTSSAPTAARPARRSGLRPAPTTRPAPEALGYLHGHGAGVTCGPEDQHRLAGLEGHASTQCHPGRRRVHAGRRPGHFDILWQGDGPRAGRRWLALPSSPTAHLRPQSRPARRPATARPVDAGIMGNDPCWCSAARLRSALTHGCRPTAKRQRAPRRVRRAGGRDNPRNREGARTTGLPPRACSLHLTSHALARNRRRLIVGITIYHRWYTNYF